MHPWFRYETYIAASCAAALWVAFLSHWLAYRFSPPDRSRPVKLCLLLLGTLCLLGNSIRAADLSCVNGVLGCPAMKGMIDTSTAFLLDALALGSLAYMRSLQVLQSQMRHVVPRTPAFVLGALLVAFHVFSIVIAVIEKELLRHREENEPALVRALTSKYVSSDILVSVLVGFIVFVCVRLRRSLLRHLHTLTAVTHNAHHNTPTNSKRGLAAGAGGAKVKKSSTAPAPPAPAASAHATGEPGATSGSGERRLPSDVTPGRTAVAAQSQGRPTIPRPVQVAPHTAATATRSTTGSPTIGSIPEDSEVTAAAAAAGECTSPAPLPPASSVVGAAEMRAHEISMAVRKLLLSVVLVVCACILGIATSFQSMISGLRGDAAPLRPLIYPPDPDSYSERRLLVYMLQCVGLLIIVWYTWKSPRRWIDSLTGRSCGSGASDAEHLRPPPPFWATCVHGLSVTSSSADRAGRRGREGVVAEHQQLQHQQQLQAQACDAVIEMAEPAEEAEGAGAGSPESQMHDAAAAAAFLDPRGFAIARGELDSMASYAPTGLSMRSGVTSIKAQQLPGAVYDAYASRYGGPSMLLGGVTHLGAGGAGGACECPPGHCYCAPEMDEANFTMEEDQVASPYSQ